MVQTGFKAEAHCWKCFKENQDLTLMDGKAMNLCKGCLYIVKQMSQWLNAYGLGIRQVTILSFSEEELSAGLEKGKKRVSREKKGAEGTEPMLGDGEPELDSV